MNIYRITNITNKLGKRDDNFNTTLNITYVDNMEKKKISLKPQNNLYLIIKSLPLSVRKLRMKKLITVEEISNKEFEAIQRNENSKKSSKGVTTTTTTKKTKTKSKKTKKRTNTTSKKSTTTTTTTTEKIDDFLNKDNEIEE